MKNWISSTHSLIACLNELMYVSKVRPTEKSGQEPRLSPAGGSPGQAAAADGRARSTVPPVGEPTGVSPAG